MASELEGAQTAVDAVLIDGITRMVKPGTPLLIELWASGPAISAWADADLFDVVGDAALLELLTTSFLRRGGRCLRGVEAGGDEAARSRLACMGWRPPEVIWDSMAVISAGRTSVR